MFSVSWMPLYYTQISLWDQPDSTVFTWQIDSCPSIRKSDLEPRGGFCTSVNVSLAKGSHMTTPKHNRMGMCNPPIEMAPQRGKAEYLANITIIHHREPNGFVYHCLFNPYYYASYIVGLCIW